MSDLPTTFLAHLTTAAGPVSVVLGPDKTQMSIWGLYESVPWMIISGYISKGTTTQNRTADGKQIIINWSAVQFVTYDNPWADISSENAVKSPA